jgi:hypothetical protein
MFKPASACLFRFQRAKHLLLALQNHVHLCLDCKLGVAYGLLVLQHIQFQITCEISSALHVQGKGGGEKRAELWRVGRVDRSHPRGIQPQQAKCGDVENISDSCETHIC